MKVCTDMLHVLEGRWSQLRQMGVSMVNVEKDRRKHAQTENEERKGGGCEYGQHT